MKKVSAFVISFLFICSAVFAQVLYLPEEEPVKRLEELYHSAGKVIPMTYYPFSREELARLAEELAEGSQDMNLIRQVDEYLEYLDYDPGQMVIGVRAHANFESYIRSEDVWGEFHRIWIDTRPIAMLNMYYFWEDVAGLEIKADLKRKETGFSATNVPDSREGDPFAAEYHFLRKGLFWYNFDPLEVTFGRTPVHFGPLRNSLLPSSRLPFLDLLRLKLPLGLLTMDMMITTLENRKATSDVDISSTNYAFGENLIISALHRFEFDFDFLRFAISGLEIYVREKNGFALGDFFPVFSWHQSDIVPNNLCMVIDADIVPFPGFHLMAQYGMDDFPATAIGLADEPLPLIDAWILGAEYSTPLSFAGLNAYAEVGRTHYLYGNYGGDNNQFPALARAIYRLAMTTGYRAIPYTSPFGPGALWIMAEAGLDDLYYFDLLLHFLLLQKNTAANLITTPYYESASVANAPIDTYVTIGLDVNFAPFDFIEVFAEPELIIGPDSTWVELTLGGSLKLDSAAVVQEGPEAEGD